MTMMHPYVTQMVFFHNPLVRETHHLTVKQVICFGSSYKIVKTNTENVASSDSPKKGAG